MPNPRKSNAQKLAEGNPGKRKLKPEAQGRAGEPLKPTMLVPAASAEWDAIVPMLLGMGVLNQENGKALANYCMAYARWEEAEAAISKYGILISEPVTNKAGDVVGERLKKNPACTVANECRKEMRAALGTFGLDPASRGKVGGAPAPEKSLLERILDGDGEDEHVN